MAKIDYNAWQQYSNRQSNNTTSGNKLNFLQLKGDGDYAIVRFLEIGPETYDIGAIHTLGKENKYKRVSCIRTPYEPLENCPLCASGQKVMMRMYVKCIQYVEENGEIVEKPSLWDRPAGFAKQLNSLIEEYGDLDKCLFKVVRSGDGLDTKYDIMYAPTSKYPDEKYPITTKCYFDNFSAFGRLVKEYTYEQLQELASGKTLDQIYQGSKQSTSENLVETTKHQESVAKKVETNSDGFTMTNDLPIEPKYETNSVEKVVEATTQPTTQVEQRQRKPWEVPTENYQPNQTTPRRRY